VMPPGALNGIDADEMAGRLAALFGHDLADQPPIVDKQLDAMRAYDATPRLGELADVPTLVVNAFHDPIAPPSAGWVLSSGIPGARYVELPDASHGVPIQNPDQINRLLLDHLGAAVSV
jgi:pimeloyl-ACP methyl ester carboxylesterase